MVLFRLRLAARRLRINGNFMLRSHHTAKSGECFPSIAKLSERKILKIRGKDSSKFLQGIITNDMNCLVEKHTDVMYTMFLNAQGRVLYDAFLYSVPDKDNEYLLECDADAADGITVHMKRYKLRAKVEVSDANEFEAWAMFSCGEGKFDAHASESNQNILICQDPRLDRLGLRIITPLKQSPVDLLGIKDCNPADTSLYKMHRYALGIAEGMQEIPSGNALPLEYNLALTNGVNFHKGCYIGQELTARTHHTGVIRKRLMPIQLKDNDSDSKTDSVSCPQFAAQTPIKTNAGKSAGRLCAMLGEYGLGILRLKEVFDSDYLVAVSNEGNEIMLTAERPNWWPEELKY